MDSIRRAFGAQDQDEESGILGRLSESTTLSWETRLWGFGISFLSGLLFSMLAFLFFWTNVGTFAALYTIGNIMSLCSTMFLLGPMKQLKNIFAPTRLVASIVVIASFVLTLVCAFVLKNVILALLMVVVQWCALAWYSISYIPFARDAVSKICCSIVN